MKWAIPRLFAALFALAAVAGCDSPQPPPAESPPPQINAADTIFVGGDIVTINDKQPTAEALAVKGGRIIAVGARLDVEKAHIGPDQRMTAL